MSAYIAWSLRNDAIRRAVFRIKPKFGSSLKASAQRDERTGRNIELCESAFHCFRAIDQDVNLRLIGRLMDAQIRGARDGPRFCQLSNMVANLTRGLWKSGPPT